MRYFGLQGALIGYLIAFELPVHQQFPFLHFISVPPTMSFRSIQRPCLQFGGGNVHISSSSRPGDAARQSGFSRGKSHDRRLLPFLIYFSLFSNWLAAFEFNRDWLNVPPWLLWHRSQLKLNFKECREGHVSPALCHRRSLNFTAAATLLLCRGISRLGGVFTILHYEIVEKGRLKDQRESTRQR